MASSKGNRYPVWGISSSFQVFAVDPKGKVHMMSDPHFAMSVTISEDGTVWVLATTPDPDGGGAKLYWSNGDHHWGEISTPDEGGVRVAGGKGSQCFYLTFTGDIKIMDTDGHSQDFYSGHHIIDFDYGGGMIWGIMSDEEDQTPRLQFADADTLAWKTFSGDPMPSTITVDHEGNCKGVMNSCPVLYSKDGISSASVGNDLDGKTLGISAKYATYLLSTEDTMEGNRFYRWQETVRSFAPMPVRGMALAASYHR